MADCLFCKIINKEIPSEIIYEDEAVVAFLDIQQVNPGHVLVVPKKHCQNLLDVDLEILKKIIVVIPKIAQAILSGLGYEAFNLGVNNGKIAGQIIPHLHFHIMPRKEGDNHHLFMGQPYTSDEEMKNVGEKIKIMMK